MKKIRVALFLVVALFAFSVVAQAATYGYVSVEGKKLSALQREVKTIEHLIKSWPNGEVLFKKETSSGFVFKKHKVFMVFAGNNKEISKFLTDAPYPGDFLKNITVRYCFGKVLEGQNKAEKVRFINKKFANIRKALVFNVGQTAAQLGKKMRVAKSYNKTTVTFYTIKWEPENLLFNLVDGKTIVKKMNFDSSLFP